MSGEATRSGMLPDLWDDAHAAKLDEPGRLLYRSNLLGSDLRITNFGGGNTSAKVTEPDPLTGAPTTVLWVKGSGGDIGSMKRDGFSTLYLDKLIGLKKRFRGIAHEDEMVALFDHCTFNLNPRACSIDTPLHGFVPHAHVDHVHADAVIAIAASENAEALTKEVFGDTMGFLPWQRPGFDLGLKLGALAEANPKLIGVVLGGHGLFTWGPTAKESYQTTIATINKASAWLEARMRKPAFGGAKHESLSLAARRDAAAKLLPQIRARISAGERKLGHFSDAPEVLEFVNAKAMPSLAPLGTSCPDHFLRTKIRPLVLAFDPAKPDIDATIASLDAALEAYRKDYAAYYDRCKHANSPAIRDANAVVYLAPGLGMFTFAKDKATARIASEFYVNAINVMRGASGVSTYVGLAEQEAFNIEYWLLEEAKLKRLPKPKSLAGRVALVTGGAGGIGRAIASQQLGLGACVVLADIDAPALEEAVADFKKQFGKDVVTGVQMNVTDEAAVDAAFTEAVLAYGGLDILISNAGIASAAPFEDTTLETWNRNISLMATGYFLAARAGFRLMKTQKSGNIVFIASKNGLAASPGASAYCTAKAAEIHLARCLALEGAPHGIRVNTVNPDAVLRGSKIWKGEWRTQRAASNKVSEGDLEEVYRQRSMLKLSVYPEDIAEAVTFFVSDASAKSTGNILNVDAGNLVSFPMNAFSRGAAMTYRIPQSLIDEANARAAAAHDEDYHSLGRRLARSGVAIDTVTEKVAGFVVAVPTWGVGTGGTRFARFPGVGEPRGIFDKLEDCATIQQLTKATPTCSPHFPWDKVSDYSELNERAKALGVGFDAVNSNTFQDQAGQALSYKYGSLSHTNKATRALAIEHNLECIDIGKKIGSKALTVWIADGSNFPGQSNLNRVFDLYLEAMAEVYAGLPADWRVFIEHKVHEPAFYSTVIADWGSSLMAAQALGPKAFCLVDLGHHSPNANIEQIVARLVRAGKLAGFHFNNSKYGDDDLDAGSVDPFRLFRVFNELVDAERRKAPGFEPAYMIDQSHNVTDPIESLIASAVEIQRCYAQALLVDRKALEAAQEDNDVMGAHLALKAGYQADVSPILAEARRRQGGAIDPIGVYRQSGYRAKKGEERPAVGGSSSGIV